MTKKKMSYKEKEAAREKFLQATEGMIERLEAIRLSATAKNLEIKQQILESNDC